MLSSLVISESESETERIGYEFGKMVGVGDVVFLYGPLGAGKTTFLRGMARALGFDDVFSPSFVIISIYPTNPPLYHIDLYRIQGENELKELGLEEILGEDCIAVVEWAEKLSGIYKGKRAEVYIAPLGETEREIRIEWVEKSV